MGSRVALATLLALLGALALAALAGLTMAPAIAQSTAQVPATASPIADVSGPGQAVPQPASQCPRTVACRYQEQNLLPDGYRLQSLNVCGANCTTQYWVGSIPDGQQLLEIDPLRGGAVLAVGRAAAPNSHPPLRVVMPLYAPTDAACCPSSYTDTTYTWDPASNTLVAGEPLATPADQFPGYDATRQQLTAEGWLVAGI